MKNEKTRFERAMEAHEVTIDELKAVLKNIYDPKLYDDGMIDSIALGLIFDDDYIIRFINGKAIIAIALLCNVSTDYLLGLTDSMNWIG